MFGDAEKLNGIFELNDLRLLKESKNISLIEPLDISKNKIEWNTALFYHMKSPNRRGIICLPDRSRLY